MTSMGNQSSLNVLGGKYKYSPSGQYRRRKNFSRIAFPSSAPYSNGVCAASPRSNRLGDPTVFPAASLVVSKFPGIFAQGECLRRRNITLAVTTATNTTDETGKTKCQSCMGKQSG